jgi:glucose/mannose-6-phosphate isomerase
MRKSILDDTVAMAKIDRSGMLEVLEEIPCAYDQAYDSASGSRSLPHVFSSPPPYLAFVGMGGSAIAADIVKEWFFNARTSIEPIRGSKLPGSIGPGTCVLIASYSGQTAEALEALNEARKRGAEISCIGSGGNLLQLCSENGIPHIKIASGLQPREALPHLLCASLVTLERWAICDHQTIRIELTVLKEQLQRLRKKIGVKQPQAKNPAKQLALKLHETIPFIYASRHLAPAGRRFKNQLNENSKMLAKFEVLPEMLHNEVQGWQMLEEGFADHVSFVLLNGNADEQEIEQFMRMKRLMHKRGVKKVHEVRLNSPTIPTGILTTIYYCDFVSFYLAIARGVDPTPVRTIQSLKSAGWPSNLVHIPRSYSRKSGATDDRSDKSRFDIVREE